MADVLFLGGPWHQQRHPVSGDLPHTLMVMSEQPGPAAAFPGPGGEADIAPLAQPVAYHLRTLHNRQPVYVAPDYPAVDQRPCAVPVCDRYARVTFVAAENGRLAGREWRWGDEIRLCPKHGDDVYRAQHVHGIDQLPEWLRADAKLDALDAFDAADDGLYGTLIDRQRRRILAVGPVR